MTLARGLQPRKISSEGSVQLVKERVRQRACTLRLPKPRVGGEMSWPSGASLQADGRTPGDEITINSGGATVEIEVEARSVVPFSYLQVIVSGRE